jgi:hypothetical protein
LVAALAEHRDLALHQTENAPIGMIFLPINLLERDLCETGL